MRGYFSQTMISLLVLLASLVTQASALRETSSPGTNSNQRTCNEIRTEITQVFLKNKQQEVPQQLIPLWVELALPKACRGMNKQSFKAFNPSSTQDTGGPLGTIGSSGTIYTKSMKMRKKRNAEERTNNVEEPTNQVRLKREAADDVTNRVMDGKVLNREKRFLHGMALGGSFGAPSGPKKEISESAQMMNMFLMLSKLQKRRFNAEMGRRDPSSNNFYGERASFGGLYGDQYMGRKKREALTPAMEASVSNTAKEAVIRKKRFIFSEPGDVPAAGANPISHMMGIMMGTAHDPNTGKKLEFGGDAMKNMMRTSFINTLPENARPPSGKEPGDFVKNMAPLWYFSRLQRSMNPPVFRMKDPGDYSNYPMRTSGHVQRRNKDGTFGDPYPAGRKKRSTDDNSDSSNSDIVTIGDMSIPLDFFRPPEQSETLPPTTPLPMYYPVYYPQPRMTSRIPYRPPMGAITPNFASSIRRMINSPAVSMRGYPMTANHFVPSHNSAPYNFVPTAYRRPIAPQQLTPTIHHPNNHRRTKRAAENSDGSSNNDVLTVGDVSIPMDFFKRSDDYQSAQPLQPRYVPVYRPVYVNRYLSYYQRQPINYPAQYYRRYAQAAQNWQRTNQVYSTPQARHWKVPYNYAHRPVQPPTPVNRWPQPAAPVNRWTHPQTPINNWTPPPAPANQWTQPVHQPPTYQAPPPHSLTPTARQQPPNPFLPPVPPVPPNHVPPSHRRVKRSDNNDKTDTTSTISSNALFPFLFPSTTMISSWFSPSYKSPAKVMVSNSPTNGAIYGDSLPWVPQRSSNFASSLLNPLAITPTSPLLSFASSLRPTSGMGPLDMFYGNTQPRKIPLPQTTMSPNTIFPLSTLNKNPYSYRDMPPGRSLFSPIWSSQRNTPKPFPPASSPQQIYSGASPFMQPMPSQLQTNPLHSNALMPRTSDIITNIPQPTAQSQMLIPTAVPGALPPQNSPIAPAAQPQNPPIVPAVPPQNPPIAPAAQPQNPPIVPAVQPQSPLRAVSPQNPPITPAVPPQTPPITPVVAPGNQPAAASVPPENSPFAPTQPLAAQLPNYSLSTASSGAAPMRDSAFHPPPLPASHPSPFLPAVW